MNNFNVTVTIEDLICSNNCKDKDTKTKNITSINDSINLKENYVLNIVNVTNTYFTIIVQNGINTIIRNIFTSYSTKLCLPCKCGNHILTISGIINKVL